jgi:hypothetical protein
MCACESIRNPFKQAHRYQLGDDLKPLSKPYTITLEASKTGKADSSDWDQGTIPLDFPVARVTGVFSAADGSGSNYWTGTFSGGTASDNWLHLSAAALAAIGDDTNVWITYQTGNTYDVPAGVPLGQFNAAALVTIPTVLNSITAISDNATPVDYEITGLTTGQTLAAEIRFVPPLNGVVITQVEVNTSSSDLDIGIYQGDQTTGTSLNLKFTKATINELYNSSTEYPNLRVVMEDDAWRLGVVDAGTAVIGAAVFTGVGLNDMTSGGAFSGSDTLDYRVEIDGTGAPDTFRWSDDGGVTWDASLQNIVGGPIALNNGVTVTFAATTGHTATDRWDFSITGIYGPATTTITVRGYPLI